MSERSTSIHTVLRLLLRELRQQAGRPHAQITQLLGRTTGSWSKVEGGDADLTLEQLLTVCHACETYPWAVLQTAEEYVQLLTREGWYVARHGAALPKGEDLLSKEADAYYDLLSKYPEAIYRITSWPALVVPRRDQSRDALLGVFRWAIDMYWKSEMTAPQPPIPVTPLTPPAVVERLSNLMRDE